MSRYTPRSSPVLGFIGALLLASCQAESRLAPSDPGGPPPANIAPYAFCMVNPTITVDCTQSATGALVLTVGPAGAFGLILPNVQVQLQGPAGYSNTLLSDNTGTAGASSLPLGHYTATLGAGLPTGCSTGPSLAFDIVAATTTTTEIDAACDPFLGQVISPTLGPLAGVTVLASNITFGDLVFQTSASGGFSIDVFRAYTLTITAGLPSGCTPPSPRSVLVLPGLHQLVTISVDCQ
ncbi:MAG: hypothetical protein ABJD11_00250 [Gemmatimonadota bacterium]